MGAPSIASSLSPARLCQWRTLLEVESHAARCGRVLVVVCVCCAAARPAGVLALCVCVCVLSLGKRGCFEVSKEVIRRSYSTENISKFIK